MPGVVGKGDSAGVTEDLQQYKIKAARTRGQERAQLCPGLLNTWASMYHSESRTVQNQSCTYQGAGEGPVVTGVVEHVGQQVQRQQLTLVHELLHRSQARVAGCHLPRRQGSGFGAHDSGVTVVSGSAMRPQ